MIGQTMINVKASGARTRLSTFLAGVFLLVLVVGLGDVVAAHPDGRAGGRDDLRLASPPSTGTAIAPATLRRMPEERDRRHGGHRRGRRRHPQPGHRRRRRRPRRHGDVRPPRRPLRRASPTSPTPTAHPGRYCRRAASSSSPRATTSSTQFDYAGDPDNVVIDLSASHIWDASTVAALDAITQKYAAKGKTVKIIGPQRLQPGAPRPPRRPADRRPLTLLDRPTGQRPRLRRRTSLGGAAAERTTAPGRRRSPGAAPPGRRASGSPSGRGCSASSRPCTVRPRERQVEEHDDALLTWPDELRTHAAVVHRALDGRRVVGRSPATGARVKRTHGSPSRSNSSMSNGVQRRAARAGVDLGLDPRHADAGQAHPLAPADEGA